VTDALPPTLRGAVALLSVEAAGLAVLTAIELHDLFTVPARYPQWAVALGVVLTGLTVLVAFLAYRLSRRRGGGRNSAVALHVLALPVGYYLLQAGRVEYGLLAFAVCVAGVALLLAPPTTRALGLR
jgi:hypothetical protein